MLREELLTTMADVPAIVLDCGTSQSRIGFSTKTEPYTVLPTVVGRPRHGSPRVKTKCFVGDDAYEHREILTIKRPIEYGCVTNWEDMEQVFHTLIYNKLQAEPENHPFMIVEEPIVPTANREKTIQIMFETFSIPSLCMKTSSETSLFTSGRTSGMVVEIGGGLCTPTPVFKGYVLRRNVMKTVASGNDLTYALLHLLNKNNPSILMDRLSREWAKDIKEKFCYVALDFEEEDRTFSYQQEKQYELCDGRVITVGKERFHCPEALLQPLLVGEEMPGLHEITFNAINRCDSDIRSELFSNVFLCGGSSLFPGLASRFEKELKKLSGPQAKVQVIASSSKHVAYQGAAMIASAPDFLQKSMSKEFYDEYGPSGIQRIFI